MEERFFREQKFNINFNLRYVRSQTPTAIYAVVYMDGKQFKYATHNKVYPHQWDNKKQECRVSSLYTMIDNENNLKANCKIWRMKEVFQRFLLYICSHPDIDKYEELKLCFSSIEDEEDINNKNRIKDMGKQKENALLWLEQQISKEYDIPQNHDQNGKLKGTGHTYLSQIKKIKEYVSTLDTGYIGWDDITSKFIQGYYNYLINKEKDKGKDKGKKNKVKTSNRYIDTFIQRLNKYAVPEGKMKKSDVQNLTYKKIKSQEEDYHIALRESEIALLRKFRSKTNEDIIIRDMILLCCTTGQRFSDYPKVLSSAKIENGRMYIDLIQEKRSKSVKVPILFELAQEIILKYKDKIPSVDNNKMNNRIKQIAKEVGITSLETIAEQRGNDPKPVEKKVERWELITTHTGRRSFASILKLREWDDRKIAEYGGWKDTEMVEHYCKLNAMEYDIFNSTPEDERLKLIEGVTNESKQPSVINTKSLDGLLQYLFKEKDLLDLKMLHHNHVDILPLDKTNEVRKYLEDISRADRYKQAVLDFFNSNPQEMKTRLIEILDSIALLDSSHDCLKIAVTTLQKLGLNCQYSHNTYKYAGKSAREAYILVTVTPNGDIIIK